MSVIYLTCLLPLHHCIHTSLCHSLCHWTSPPHHGISHSFNLLTTTTSLCHHIILSLIGLPTASPHHCVSHSFDLPTATVSPCHSITVPLSHYISHSFDLPTATMSPHSVIHLNCPLKPFHHITVSPCHI